MKKARLICIAAAALIVGVLMLLAVKPDTARTWILLTVAWIALTLLIWEVVVRAARYVSTHFALKRDVLLILLFMFIITVPMIARDDFDAAKENRTEAPFPAVVNSEFPTGFDRWFNDHFGFRSAMTRCYVGMNYLLFDQLISCSAMVGKDDWLFYTAKTDGNPVADFQGTNLFTDAELKDILERQTGIEQDLLSRGIQYVLFIAPNKGTIYPELYPEGIEKESATSRLDQVIAYLSANTEIPIVDARDALWNAKTDATLYYSIDTHWNTYGAFIAYQVLMETVSRAPLMAAYRSGLIPDSMDDYTVSETHDIKGDLLTFTQIPRELFRGINTGYTFAPRTPYRYTQLTVEDNRVVTTIDDPSLPRALIYRDSFFSAMYPFVVDHFSYADVRWVNPMADTIRKDIETVDVDIVIVEIVERYLTKL